MIFFGYVLLSILLHDFYNKIKYLAYVAGLSRLFANFGCIFIIVLDNLDLIPGQLSLLSHVGW